MPTFTYTGTLTDVGLGALTDRLPRLRVRPEQEAWGPDGPISQVPQDVVLDPATGAFSIDLIPSTSLAPPTRYVLDLVVFVESVEGDVAVGVDQWKFTALPGGGPIPEMVNAPVSIWWVGPPFPSPLRPGFYHDLITDDVGEWSR